MPKRVPRRFCPYPSISSSGWSAATTFDIRNQVEAVLAASPVGRPTGAATVPGYEAVAFFGFGITHGTPKEIVDLLNKEINLAIQDPGIQARLKDLGGIAVPGSPGDFGKFLAAEPAKWEKVVHAPTSAGRSPCRKRNQ